MPNPILHKRSSTAGVVPHAALLANGEIALNSADGTWFIKKTDGTVLDLRQPLITDGGDVNVFSVARSSSGVVIPSRLYIDAGKTYVTHIFTESGTLELSSNVNVEYLIVGGGGGGGRANSTLNLGGGGGGAGGLQTNIGGAPLYLPRGVISITVGAGGAGATGAPHNGNDGGDSALGTFIVAKGGGGGGLASNGGASVGRAGGSGGGAGGNTTIGSLGGSGVIGQGNAGGNSTSTGGSGGGGASAVGAVGFSGGAGGTGAVNNITGVNIFYAGGGGGGGSSTTGALGGAGGGGAGAGDAAAGGNGTPNTGGGGGGARGTATSFGGNGGSGVVIVRYQSVPRGTNADAQDWQARVIAAGGTVSATTFTAVNNFCNAITAAGIRDRFIRLNLFCGTSAAALAAVRTPLFRGQSLGGTQFGNATDTNVNFVAGDYAETGASGGLKGDGLSKWLNTGVAANALTASNSHMGFGLLATQTGAVSYRTLGGAYDGTGTTFEMAVRRSDSLENCFFTRAFTATDRAGVAVQSASLAAGNVLMAYPSFYRNGVQTGAIATTSQNYPAAHEIYIFALNQSNSGNPINRTDARLSWYSIGLTMTPAQVAAFDAAVRDFQVALNRTPPAVSNADAQDWVNRVYAAGVTVSQSTATAVDNFCNAIDAAGIRDRFYRLNLFCGDNLTACLVPLYRGQSLGGTQFGNATDTNNSFVSGDYVETGVTGGLKGDGSAKYLNTGLNVSDLPLGNRHISVYEVTKAAGQYRVSIGNRNTNAFFELDRELDSPPTYTFYGMSDGGARPASDIAYTTPSVHFLGQNASTTLSTLFKNGVAVGSNSLGTVTTAPTAPVFVFALRNGASVSDFSDVRLGSYSLGLSMTDAQVAAYTSAMRTFQAALGRRGPVVSNADAQNWIDRVYAAGGTVSQSTAAAVNTFCNSINSTGLRDRFYRLNLFCGNDLTACLVPLYRGPSLTGTQFGNATDTNNNFVSSDYVETGVNGGLRGGSNKGLNTGVPVNFSTATDTHLAAYESALPTGNDRPLIGIDTNPVTPRVIYSLYHLNSAQLTYYDGTDANNPFFAGTRVPAFFIGSNQSTRRDLFLNGVTVASVGGAKTVTGTQTSPNFTVFSFPNAGGFFHDGKLNAYSLGYALNATAAQAYYNIMQAFQTTLNRAV